jgi:TolB-like protein/DNA-binding winged helix-turn-helix (wHTH) protein/Tfp pilus assembly protein PilF
MPVSGPESHLIYEFGEFRLDAHRRLLFARDSPHPLSIKPKVYETILYFVEHPGEILEKDRLLADLWPGLVVEENNLTQAISVVRRVLGEARGENRYLATVPGRGYRFVADVVRVTQPRSTIVEQPAAGLRRSRWTLAIGLPVLLGLALLAYGWQAGWWLAGEQAGAAVSALPSRTVAILPFENLSAEASDEFIALGLSESVLHRLASVRDLTLIARTSSFALRERPAADAREIGRLLNARYLVEGSVRRAGEELRVTAQLIDANTGGHVWSLQFDRRLDDIFAVEDEIAQSVARALELSLTEERHPFERFGTEAYLTFLQGRALVASRTIADAERAIERFSRAVELAPDFAAAYAALADAHRHLAYLHEDRSDGPELMAQAVARAEPLLARALKLDAELGEAYVMRADIRHFKGDMAGAEADYRKGLALNPSYGVGHEHFADFLDNRGRTDEALAEFDYARRVDPLTPRNHYRRGLSLLLNVRTAEALQEAEALFLESLRVAPDFHPALMRLAQMRWNNGRFAEAIKLAEQAVAIDPRAQWMRWFLVDFYLELDQVDAARDVLAGQPLPVEPAQWLTVCLYEKELERAANLVRLDPNRSASWFADYDLAAYSLRDAAHASGELDRGRRELNALRLDPRSRPASDAARLATLAQVNQAMGDRVEAERLARQVLEHGAIGHPQAVALVVLGQNDAALEVLEQAQVNGRRDGSWYTFDREVAFEPLRGEPRFQALATNAQAHAAVERKLLEQMRARGEVPDRTKQPQSSSAIC